MHFSASTKLKPVKSSHIFHACILTLFAYSTNNNGSNTAADHELQNVEGKLGSPGAKPPTLCRGGAPGGVRRPSPQKMGV